MPDHVDFAFLCAMPMELKPLVRRLSLRRECVGDLTLHCGELGPHHVVATVTGMGTERARVATQRALSAIEIGHVVVVGITGAVDDTTPIGTLILPEAVVDSATGNEYHPDPIHGGEPRGIMWTTDVLYTDVDFIAGLRARGVVSLDMETAAIAAVCEERGVPWSVVRAISDRATDGSVDEEIFGLSNPDGTTRPLAAMLYLLRNPGRLPNLLRLARNSQLATEAAATAAIAACSKPGQGAIPQAV